MDLFYLFHSAANCNILIGMGTSALSVQLGESTLQIAFLDVTAASDSVNIWFGLPIGVAGQMPESVQITGQAAAALREQINRGYSMPTVRLPAGSAHVPHSAAPAPVGNTGIVKRSPGRPPGSRAKTKRARRTTKQTERSMEANA